METKTHSASTAINKKHLIIIYTLGLLSALYMIIFVGPILGGDTQSYLNSWNHFANGVIDNDRLPSYAYLVGLATKIGGAANVKFTLVLIQNIIALLALYPFYRIVNRLTNSPFVALIATIAIAILPYYTSWHNRILTESVSMSGMIFITAHAIAIYDGRSRWHILGFGLWLLFLTFLKPSLAYLIPVFIVAFAIMIWQKRRLWRNACGAFLAIAIPVGAMLCYMSAYKSTYGVFASSRVGSLNAYFNMRNNCTLDASKATDKALAKYISDSYDKYGRTPFTLSDSLLWADSYYPYEHFKFTEYYHVVKESMRENLPMQIFGIASRFYYSGKDLYFQPQISTPLAVFNFSIGWIYMLVIVYGIWILVRWRSTRRLPLLSFLLLMLGASQIIVNVVGAQGEWARLICPTNAIYVVIAAQLLTQFFARIARRNR